VWNSLGRQGSSEDQPLIFCLGQLVTWNACALKPQFGFLLGTDSFAFEIQFSSGVVEGCRYWVLYYQQDWFGHLKRPSPLETFSVYFLGFLFICSFPENTGIYVPNT
jgi:hypothetical protein